MGKYQGTLYKDFINAPDVQIAFKNYNIPIPGGESINQLNTRLYNFIEKICKNSSYKNICMISHSAAISNLCAYISGSKYENIQSCILTYSVDEGLKLVSKNV